MAKQFEYLTNKIVRKLYDEYLRKETGSSVYYMEQKEIDTTYNDFINKLGKEGWEFFPNDGGFFGKREIPQERHNSYSESESISR